MIAGRRYHTFVLAWIGRTIEFELARWTTSRQCLLAQAIMITRMGPSQQRPLHIRHASSPHLTDPSMWLCGRVPLDSQETSADGIVITIAGSGDSGFVDRSGNEARFNWPIGMALTASGTLIVCDAGNSRLRRVDPHNGHVTAIEHQFQFPRGMAHKFQFQFLHCAPRHCRCVGACSALRFRLIPRWLLS